MKKNIEKIIEKVIVPTLLVTSLILVSCSKDDRKIALGDFNGGGGGFSDGLAKADEKTSTPANINTLIQRMNTAADNIKAPEELSGVIFKALLTEFNGLKSRPVKVRQNPSRNDKKNNTTVVPVVAIESAESKFNIEALSFNKQVIEDNTVYTIDLKYKDTKKLKLIEVTGGSDSFIILEARGENKLLVRAIYTEALGKEKDVSLLIIKKYVDNKIVSVDPFVEFNIIGQNKENHPELGAFNGMQAYVNPVANKGFVKVGYEKLSLYSKALDVQQKLPEDIAQYRLPNLKLVKVSVYKTEDIKAIGISIDDKMAVVTDVFSFFGLL